MIQNNTESQSGGSFVATPQTGSAVEQASAAALANITAGKTADGQVRASDGTFAPPVPAAAAAPVAGPDGQTPPKPEDGQTPPPAADAATDETQGDALPPNTVTLALEDGELDVTFPDEQSATLVRQALETAGDVAAIRAQAQQSIEETQAIREYAEVDPVGFAMQALGDSIEGKKHLVLSLLTDPAVYEALKPTLPTLATPEGMRLAAAEQKAARHEFREQAQHQIQESAAINQNLRDIQTACAAVLPSTLTPAQQQVLYADLLRDVQRAAGDAPTVPVENLPLILRNRLAANGVDPLVAAELMSQAVSAAPRSGRRAIVRTAPAPRVAATPVKPTGQQFVAAAERRKAAVIPTAGAGAPGGASDLALPMNPDGSKMSVAQTLDWHRSRVGKGQRVLGV